jgi:U3 small nucleolar RNA-associated protein 21
MEIFGDNVIIINNQNVLKIIDIKKRLVLHILNDYLKLIEDFREEVDSIRFPFTFTASKILHPHTYLNKILIGSCEGVMQLWNIKTMKMIYEYKGFNAKINCLSQSSVLDVIGIGLEDGRIIIHNLKLDKTIATFNQGSIPVLNLSFRTDKQPILASGLNFPP